MSKKTDQQQQASPEAPQAPVVPAKPASPKKTFQDFVAGKQFQLELANALPKHLTVERYIRVLMTATIRTPRLLQCTQESLFAAIFAAAQAGLEIDGRDAHLVPYLNRKKNCYEAQLIPDYKGLARLVMNTGLVANIHADCVHENDEFDYDKGQIAHHRIDLKKPRGQRYAAYCIIRMKDGTEKAEVMTAFEIEEVRCRSKASDDGPWITDTGEMWKKTVFKRAQKWVPVSPEIRAVIAAEDSREEPKNVTPKPTLAALMGASEEPADPKTGPEAPQPPVPPPPQAETPPVDVPSYTDEQRAAILKETQNLMLDLNVAEAKVLAYLHGENIAAEVDEVSALPTHVLDSLRAVVPTLAEKKEAK